MIKLIASDLDGTLLLGGAQSLPPEMYDIIRELKKKGIIFAAATGRQHSSVAKLFEPVKNDIACISENGGAVFSGDLLIYSRSIDTDYQKKIIGLMAETPGTELLVTDEFKSYIKPKNPSYFKVVENIRNEYEVVEDWESFDIPVNKLAIYEEAAIKDEAARLAFWKEKIPSPAWPVTAGIGWIDVIFPWSNKGVGMRELQEYLGVRPEECAAFGDNLNDIELLEACGMKVAQAGAKDEVKAIADYVTEDVPAFIREKFL